MSLSYELIIFDLGNVLLNYDHRITCRKLSKASKHKHPTEEIYNFLFSEQGLSRQFDQGKIKPEEFFKTIVDRFGLSISFSEFIPVWNDIFTENKAISKLARSLKEKFKLYLISNTNEMHFKYLSQKFPILSVFDKVFLSYAVGLRKPHPGIFELALNTAKVKARQAIFIDDVPEHVDAAAKLGIKAIQFTKVERLKKELSALGVVN